MLRYTGDQQHCAENGKQNNFIRIWTKFSVSLNGCRVPVFFIKPLNSSCFAIFVERYDLGTENRSARNDIEDNADERRFQSQKPTLRDMSRIVPSIAGANFSTFMPLSNSRNRTIRALMTHPLHTPLFETEGV